jgi:hypothetical protein
MYRLIEQLEFTLVSGVVTQVRLDRKGRPRVAQVAVRGYLGRCGDTRFLINPSKVLHAGQSTSIAAKWRADRSARGRRDHALALYNTTAVP